MTSAYLPTEGAMASPIPQTHHVASEYPSYRQSDSVWEQTPSLPSCQLEQPANQLCPSHTWRPLTFLASAAAFPVQRDRFSPCAESYCAGGGNGRPGMSGPYASSPMGAEEGCRWLWATLMLVCSSVPNTRRPAGCHQQPMSYGSRDNPPLPLPSVGCPPA